MKRKFLYGGYAAVITVLVIAAAVGLNFWLSILEANRPISWDLTMSRLYSLSTHTQSVLDGLTDEVTIYTLYPTGQEDMVVQKALAPYQAKCKKIKLENFDPILYPNRAAQYRGNTGELPGRGGLIIENTANGQGTGKYRLYKMENLYTQNETTQAVELVVEQRVTAALQYVTTNTSPGVYFLQGHGEPAMTSPATMQLTGLLESGNYNVQALDFSDPEAPVPQPGETVIALAPQSDLTQTEYDTLRAFLLGGGQALVAFEPVTQNNMVTTLKYFEGLLTVFGCDIALTHNLVYEDNPAYYYDYNYTKITPVAVASEVDPNTQEEVSLLPVPSGGQAWRVHFSQAQQLTFGRSSSFGQVFTLLKSSAGAYAKAIVPGTVPSDQAPRGEDDPAGPFALGLLVRQLQTDTSRPDGQLIVLGSGECFADAETLQSGDNHLLFVTLINSLTEMDTWEPISGKSYQSDLRIPNQQALNRLGLFVAVGLPLVVLAAGVTVYWRRRHR